MSEIDLPKATIDDEWTTDNGSKMVRITVEEDNNEVHYIIGQFQDLGYEVNSVDFKRNEMSFSKEKE